MMDGNDELQDIMCNEKYNSLPLLVNRLQNYFCEKSDYGLKISSKCDMLNHKFIDEIKKVISLYNVTFYLGKTLKELKCVIHDEAFREHEIYVQVNRSKKFYIKFVDLPDSPYHNKSYESIEEIIKNFKNQVYGLTNYFEELERIDRFCTIMEPIKPSFKEDYRKIFLDNRIWLHVEVTPDGCATNIHLVGQSDYWNGKLQVGLLNWDHDKNIVENITTIFDIVNASPLSQNLLTEHENISVIELQVCGICLYDKLPADHSVPQPLCQNKTCGVYFHKNCLYQWLVACVGGRPPPFGVATGSCPTCLQPIACSLKDD